ncbi:signal recognition particle subunit srp68, partial [Coemansia sp. RSA 1933]
KTGKLSVRGRKRKAGDEDGILESDDAVDDGGDLGASSSEDEDEKEYLDEADILGDYHTRRRRRKATYEERTQSIMAGREGREKFSSKKAKRDMENRSLTNREKRKTKDFRMISHKRSVVSKGKRSLVQKRHELRKHAPADAKRIEFDIFGYVHRSRQTYGMRAQDYQRYRRYCAHHLRNVRKAAKLSQGSSTSYKPKAVSAAVACEPRHIEIVVLQAERAWAFAMDLRELYSRTEEARQHYHLIRRLRAACKAGLQLVDIAHRVCDLQTAMAASAYWLQMQSQLSFELEEWEVAMDCAVFSRIISERLAVSGNSERYALSHAMIEELDPVVRLAAYQCGIRSAQQTPPSDVAAQWYEAKMKGDASRAEKSIHGYGSISAELERLTLETNSKDGSSAGGLDSASAHVLEWRGGSIGFTDNGLASLVDAAHSAVRDCAGGGETKTSLQDAAAAEPAKVESAISSFARVRKAARRCYADGVAAAEKVGSSASDKLLSSYLAIQLYSTCMLHAAAVAKNIGRAQALTRSSGVALELPLPAFGAADAAWISDHAQPSEASSGKKRGGATVLAAPTEIVILYDMARKSMGRLKRAVGEILGKISPAVGRAVQAYSVVEEIGAAEAYYACVRGYYVAMLHAHPRHRKHVDALALLDKTLNESVPEAQALATPKSSKQAALAAGASPADAVWEQVFLVASDGLPLVKARLEAAVDAVRELCASAAGEDPATSRSSAAPHSWYDDPSARPKMISNSLAAAAASTTDTPAPAHIPSLVDFSSIPFAAVPMKPIFYDLAAPAIEFDIATIEARAGKPAPGGSKLGSIIGSLWGSR